MIETKVALVFFDILGTSKRGSMSILWTKKVERLC